LRAATHPVSDHLVLEASDFALQSGAVLEAGKIRFANDSSIASVTLRFSVPDELSYDASDAGIQPPSKGRYYVYAALYSTPAMAVKLSRDLKRVGIWRLEPGEDHGRAAVHDGKHFWVGLQMSRFNPGQLWRVDDE
jgi:hypothetical protein